MKIFGLTGGIASGKTTVVKFLKSKRFQVHDSDAIIKKIYNNQPLKFKRYLKKNKIIDLDTNKKINKNIVRKTIFNNVQKRKLLEAYLHNTVEKSRNKFLKTHKRRKTKLVFLDIPLLFEKRLNKICDYTILLYAPLNIRKRRAMQRQGMEKKILNKIIKTQMSDGVKKKRANFIINTSTTKKQTFKKILSIIYSLL